MAWTYSSDPSASQKDAVRFMIQDTQTTRQLAQDEEIEWAIAQEANVYMAAARLCDIFVIRFGGITRKKIADFEIQFSPAFYKDLGNQLRARGSSYQTPYAGGISQADKEILQDDADWVAPAFSKNMNNNPTAPQPTVAPSSPLTTF